MSIKKIPSSFEINNLDSLNQYIQDYLVPLIKFNNNSAKGILIYLSGDLGAGKTTLVRSLFKQLGYKRRVKSPTFALVEEYSIIEINKKIYHFDLYRLNNTNAAVELEAIGFRDYLESSICLIEWAENASIFLPKPDLWLKIVESQNDLHKLESRNIISLVNLCQ